MDLLAKTSGSEGRAASKAAIGGYRFSSFEVNLAQWELRKRGLRVGLQKKPFQILRILLERPGELVTRTRLAEELWPDLHVEYERSLNTAINCLRQALGDSSRSCRYIETVPGHGYRFTAPVDVMLVNDTAREKPESGAEADHARGRFFFNKMTPEGFSRATAYFESAVRADAGHAPSHASLASIQSLLASWSFLPTRAAAQKAHVYAQAASTADPGAALSHTALATSARLLRRPSREIEGHHLKAIAADNGCADSHMFYGEFLCAQQRMPESVDHLKRAARLDALSLIIHFKLACTLAASGDARAALEQSWETLMLEPGFAPAQYTLGVAYQRLGMLDEAVTEFQNACRCSNEHPAAVASLGHAQVAAGNCEEGESALARLTMLTNDRYVSQYWFALVNAGLGRYTDAKIHLAEARNGGDLLLDNFQQDARFDAYRSASSR